MGKPNLFCPKLRLRSTNYLNTIILIIFKAKSTPVLEIVVGLNPLQVSNINEERDMVCLWKTRKSIYLYSFQGVTGAAGSLE